MFYRITILFLMPIFFAGCATHSQVNKRNSTPVKESPEEVVDALEKVTEALSNQDIESEDLHKLSGQIRKDAAARTAVESVAEAMSATELNVKYCPLDGKRYSADLEFCPGTDTKLIPVE